MPGRGIVIADFIGVDYFKRNNKVKYRFLTHAHPESYEGLKVRSFLLLSAPLHFFMAFQFKKIGQFCDFF